MGNEPTMQPRKTMRILKELVEQRKENDDEETFNTNLRREGMWIVRETDSLLHDLKILCEDSLTPEYEESIDEIRQKIKAFISEYD